MAQKVNPIAVRLRFNRSSDSSWFSDYYYSTLLYQDLNFRDYLSSIRQPNANKLGFRPGKCVIHHFPKRSLIHLFCLGTKRKKLQPTLKKEGSSVWLSLIKRSPIKSNLFIDNETRTPVAFQQLAHGDQYMEYPSAARWQHGAGERGHHLKSTEQKAGSCSFPALIKKVKQISHSNDGAFFPWSSSLIRISQKKKAVACYALPSYNFSKQSLNQLGDVFIESEGTLSYGHKIGYSSQALVASTTPPLKIIRGQPEGNQGKGKVRCDVGYSSKKNLQQFLANLLELHKVQRAKQLRATASSSPVLLPSKEYNHKKHLVGSCPSPYYPYKVKNKVFANKQCPYPILPSGHRDGQGNEWEPPGRHLLYGRPTGTKDIRWVNQILTGSGWTSFALSQVLNCSKLTKLGEMDLKKGAKSFCAAAVLPSGGISEGNNPIKNRKQLELRSSLRSSLYFNYYAMHYFFLKKTNSLRDEKHINQAQARGATSFHLPLARSRYFYLSNVQSILSDKTSTFTSLRPIKVSSIFQSASLIAQEIAGSLEQKKSFRQICRSIFQQIDIGSYIKGIRISCSGRLNGAEIAKSSCRKYGETSLHVFSDKIDYAQTKASTPYGILGVKVWISYV